MVEEGQGGVPWTIDLASAGWSGLTNMLGLCVGAWKRHYTISHLLQVNLEMDMRP